MIQTRIFSYDDEGHRWYMCEHCGSPVFDRDDCPNPACWAGLAEWNLAMRVWTIERDIWVRSKSGIPRAFQEIYARNNPPPSAESFRRKL